MTFIAGTIVYATLIGLTKAPTYFMLALTFYKSENGQ
jgi:hypothetical protein